MPERVATLLGVWREEVAIPSRRVAGAGVFASLIGAAELARVGTPSFRLGAAALLVGWSLGCLGAVIARRWVEMDVKRALRMLTRGADRPLGERALRAVALADQARVDPSRGSAELAELHVARLLSQLPVPAIRAAAERRASQLQTAAIALALAGAVLFVAAKPFSVLEGLDVLVSRGGVAPLSLGYLDEVRVELHPPDYLRERDIKLPGLGPAEAPYGSLITVKGTPIHRGRRLVLTDGKVEVPFVDDGAGGLLARWPLQGDVKIEVAARLGEVRIEQGEPLTVRSIPDTAPMVEVDGAPRTARLLDESEIAVMYRALDDHGLREVDLVLRAGTREERRVLSRLDGETKQDTGGYQLRATDRFLRGSFLPVEVTVEARDNDPLTGPKWGRSPPLTLLPPAIGEPEAMRFEALSKGLDALVDYLAEVSSRPAQGGAKAPADEEAGRIESALAPLLASLDASYGGLRVHRRLAAFAEGQARRLREAGGGASPRSKKKPEPRAQASLLSTTEGVVLAVDRSLRTLGSRDAQGAAKRLSRVASEAGDGFLLAMTSPPERARGLQRAEAALLVLAPSGKAISRLGPLGADLGSIVANDLRRIRRAMTAGDLAHAELAARDLAARLSRPMPSFMGGTGGGSTESGGGKSQQPAEDGASGEESGSDDEEKFGAEGQALEELARDHAGNIEDVQQSLHRATEGGDLEGLLDEAKRHAQSVRESVSRLPSTADDPTGEASRAGKDQAQQMAEALERGDLKGAAEAGKAAQRSLDEAQRSAEREGGWAGRLQGKAAEDAAQRLSPEVKWTEETVEKLRKALADKANVGEAGDREQQLAERARSLLDKGKGEKGTLPGPSLDAITGAEQKMRDAAQALKKGEADKALAHQREAQRLLESAQPPPAPPKEASEGDEGEAPGQRESPNGKDPLFGPANIPKADEHKGPEDFRRRVVDGLKQGQPSSLKAAIKRYAERLLR